MRDKITCTFIILIFFVEIIFVNPNIDYNSTKDSQNTENPFEELLPQDANKLLANAPKAFTENRGQLENDEVRFYAQDGSVWFTDDGVWFEIREELSINSPESRVQSRESDKWFDQLQKFKEPEHVEYKRVVLKQEFVGANKVQPVGREKMGWYSNFFYGNDSSKWRIDVPNYQEIYYENIYDGIDLRYYTNEKGLKYDFIIYPGANLSQLRIKYDGAEKLALNEQGNLKIKTKLRDITEGELFIYQDYIGVQNQINGKFVIYNNLEFGFKILDDYCIQELLVIDPLVYSTYIGGIGSEQSLGMAIDTFCNVYVIGDTSSVDFPNTTGAYNIKSSGNRDVFIFKLNPAGSSLIYSTYIGGINYDRGSDIAIDSKRYIYITGWTNSSNFPNTTGSHDTTYNGGSLWGGDAFVLKLNSTGSSLIYSTFVGANDDDVGNSIAVDSSGNTFISGSTKSFNFPNTTSAFDNTYNGGYDTFIIKLSSSGSSLLYSTFIGGNDNDFPGNIAIDLNGCVYMSGSTSSIDFPTTNGVFDSTYNGNGDIYILKLGPTGSYLTYSTFVGGKDGDGTGCIAIDSNGNAYVSGTTDSSDFPISFNAYDNTINGAEDIFVLKLNCKGSSLIYSTFIGGNNWDNCADIIVDSNEYAYITCFTFSSNFPTTTDAIDRKFNGTMDGIILKLNPAGSSLIYSTFIGGNDSVWESITRLVIDYHCNIYVTGITDSNDFPNTTGAYNNIYNGNQDVFVLKLNIIINDSFPKVLDLKTSKSTILRTNTIHLYSNATDIEDLEQKLTPFFIEYRDPDYLFWNNSFFSKPVYNNSRWQISFTPPKNALLGLYDFRIMVNDTDQLFSSWFYLNDTLTVLNNIPTVENLFLSNNKAILGDNISIWANCIDIENPEENLTIRLEYRDPNEQSWETTYLTQPSYMDYRWESNFSVPFNGSFGYYDLRVRVNDSDGDYSQWLYANDSLLIYNEPPTVIDIQLSNSNVYRTNSVFLYINGTDHETLESMLTFFVQYKLGSETEWTSIIGEYSSSNHRWETEFITFKDSTLGIYDFRVRFEDNESVSSGWHYLNDSLEVLNNIPIVTDINISNDNVYRTQSITIYVNGTDVETPEELLICEAQYKSPSGNWLNISNITYNIDYREVIFTPTINAVLGYYDLRVNFIDIDNDYSNWTIIENAFEVKNNLPMISDLCTNFKVDFQPIKFDLTEFEFDIEDSGDNLTWGIDQATVNANLFLASIVDISGDIFRITPKSNISASDNITLFLTDKDGGINFKTDVTIYVDSILSKYYIVNLTIFPSYIEIIQGKSKIVTLKITNLGNLSDNYTILFKSDDFTTKDIILEMNFICLNSSNFENINVEIFIPKNKKVDDYRITFIVRSPHAIDQALLTVIVKKMEIKDKDDDKTLFNGIWIIIIIIILIVVIGFYYYRKKYAKKETNKIEETPIKSAALIQTFPEQAQILKTPAQQQILQVIEPPLLTSTESQPIDAQKVTPSIPQPSTSSLDKNSVSTQGEQMQKTNVTKKIE